VTLVQARLVEVVWIIADVDKKRACDRTDRCGDQVRSQA
jgi:hypothetical protein